MTDPGSFRTPPPVLKLEEQLRDAQTEIEDLRAENLDLKTKLAEQKRRDPDELRNARDSWTLRLFIICAVGLISWLVFSLKDCKPPSNGDERCREAVINVIEDGRYACSFPGQTMTPTADPKVYRCTCPSSPASSAP